MGKTKTQHKARDKRGHNGSLVGDSPASPVALKEPAAKKLTPTAAGPRRILYYRNPMGLPDTSPVPKKDWMGMDYIPVYEGEEQDDGKTVKVSLDKLTKDSDRGSVAVQVAVTTAMASGGRF